MSVVEGTEGAEAPSIKKFFTITDTCQADKCKHFKSFISQVCSNIPTQTNKQTIHVCQNMNPLIRGEKRSKRKVQN